MTENRVSSKKTKRHVNKERIEHKSNPEDSQSIAGKKAKKKVRSHVVRAGTG